MAWGARGRAPRRWRVRRTPARSGLSGAGPGGEALAQLGDLVVAEAEGREHPVTPLIEPLGRLGEVPAGQPRVEPPREADDLLHGVPFQGGRDIHVVARLDPAGQGARLTAHHVLEVEDGTDLHDDGTAGPV